MNDTGHVGCGIGLGLQFPTIAKAIEKTSIVLSLQVAGFRNAFNDPSDFCRKSLIGVVRWRLFFGFVAQQHHSRVGAPNNFIASRAYFILCGLAAKTHAKSGYCLFPSFSHKLSFLLPYMRYPAGDLRQQLHTSCR